MSATKKLIKGDFVKLISGSKKGTTGKVIKVLTKKNSVLVEGLGVKHRKIKPGVHNPRGGQKDIHVPIAISKVALVVDEKSGKTSRVGLQKDENGNKVRVARKLNNKEIK